jgi:hypothetical protein
MKKYLFILLLSIPAFAFAQLEKPVKWSFYAKKINSTEAIVYIKAKMSGNWHIYAQSVKQDAMRLKFSYAKSKDYTLAGKTVEPKPIKKYDNVVKMELAYFEREAVFTQKIKLAKSSALIKATVEFMACNDKQCLPADEVSFNIPVK